MQYAMADSRNDGDAHFFLPFPLALQIHLSLLQSFYAIAADTIGVASAADAAPQVTMYIRNTIHDVRYSRAPISSALPQYFVAPARALCR
jgi:hypothetical protein